MKQQSKKGKQDAKYGKKHDSKSKDSKVKFEKGSQTKIEQPYKKPSLEHLPTIETMLAIPLQQRSKRVGELFSKVQPFLHNFLQKKEGSRVAQLMFKWGSFLEVKKKIFECVQAHWKELIRSKYALYVIAKVINEKEFNLDQVADDCVTLMQGRESAQVLESYIKKNPENPKVKEIKARFIGLASKASEQMRAEEILQNIAVKAVEKSYHNFVISKLVIRLALSKMFEEEKQKALEFLIDKVADIVTDEEGVRLFIEIMNNANSKQKKTIAKLYKGNIQEIVGFNNVSYVSVIKLLTEIDDTVYISKSILDEVCGLVPKLLTCKKVFSIVFSLLSPRNHNFNVLGKYEPKVEHTLCKKPEEQRKKELRLSMYPTLVEFFADQTNLRGILKMGQEGKLVIGIVRSMLEDSYPGASKVITSIVDVYASELKQYQAKPKSDKKSEEKPLTFKELLIADPNAHKILKNILSIQDESIDPLCDKIATLLVKHIEQVLKTKASFILLGLVEKGGRNQLLDEIRNSGVKNSEVIAGEHYAKLLEDKPASSKSKPKDKRKNRA